MYTYVMEVKQIVTIEAKSEQHAKEKLYAGKYATSSISDAKTLAKLKQLEKEND